MSSRAITLAGFVAIAAAAIVLEVWDRRAGRARLVDAVQVVLATRIGRIALLAAWAWVGWHLFARGSGAFE